MKNFAFLIFLLTVPCGAALSQTFIKFNALYWLVGVTNVSVETKLGNHFTYNNEVVVSPWKSVKGNSMIIAQFVPEVRYYPDRAFKGFYTGPYTAVHTFKMTKWNYLNRGLYQKGRGFSAGLTVGYEVPINDRWLLDVYASGGWQISRYRGYYRSDGVMYADLNNSGEWIPYKIGITFAYRLGTKKVFY